jgi:hypothetical protein
MIGKFKTIKLILFFFGCASRLAAQAPFSAEDGISLGGYTFFPAQKKVGWFHSVGGTKPGGVTWDGSRFVIDTTLNYETTTLIISGASRPVQFIERMGRPFDANTLQLISPPGTFPDYWRDRHGLYFPKENLISGWKMINEKIFTDTAGRYFFLDEYGYMQPFDSENYLHSKSLKHIIGPWFYDTKGLYAYSRDFNGLLQKGHNALFKIADAVAKDSKPDLHERYFTYETVVYSSAYPDMLALQKSRLKELILDNQDNFLLTDGINFYQNNRGDYYASALNESYDKSFSIFRQGKKIIGMFYAASNRTFIDSANESIYIGDLQPSSTAQRPFKGRILLTQSGNFALSDFTELGRSSMSDLSYKQMRNIFIINERTKNPERFDAMEFEQLSADLWRYKDYLYYLGVAADEPLTDPVKILLMPNGKRSNYLQYGNKLIYIGRLDFNRERKTGNSTSVNLAKNVIKQKLGKLQFLNADMVTDGRYVLEGAHIVDLTQLKIKYRVIPQGW